MSKKEELMKELIYRKSVFNYFITLGDILSTLINHLLHFSFDGNQSLSGRCFENRHHWYYGTLRKFIDVVFSKWEHDHCESAFMADGFRGEHMSKKVRDYMETDEYREKQK